MRRFGIMRPLLCAALFVAFAGEGVAAPSNGLFSKSVTGDLGAGDGSVCAPGTACWKAKQKKASQALQGGGSHGRAAPTDNSNEENKEGEESDCQECKGGGGGDGSGGGDGNSGGSSGLFGKLKGAAGPGAMMGLMGGMMGKKDGQGSTPPTGGPSVASSNKANSGALASGGGAPAAVKAPEGSGASPMADPSAISASTSGNSGGAAAPNAQSIGGGPIVNSFAGSGESESQARAKATPQANATSDFFGGLDVKAGGI